MTWKPPVNANKREPEALAEFVRWDRIGDAVIGKIVRFGENKFGGFAELAPCIVYPAGKRPAAHAVIALGLSANLTRKVPQGMLGKVIGVRYSDVQGTNNGQMKIFDVYELDAAQLREYLDALGATDLLPADLGTSAGEPTGADDEAEDGLPF